MTKRVHCDLIKAWADGAKIQVSSEANPNWKDIETPQWYATSKYRIRPAPPVTKYRWAYINYKDVEHITIGWFSKEEINTWAKQVDATVLGKIAETKKIFLIN